MAAKGTPDGAIREELSGLALNLASYLAEAGQLGRLMRLFADDRWLRRRVGPGVPDWDGYQQDIDAAWDTLDQTLAAPQATADPMPEPRPARARARHALLGRRHPARSRDRGGFHRSLECRTGRGRSVPPSLTRPAGAHPLRTAADQGLAPESPPGDLSPDLGARMASHLRPPR